ncbi:pyridoxamine 5'-phosphate oxidase [Pseudobacter ginsenosidimutans]|uniref:Pyridoxine/pyridoxamine 5'-phosphate oxidase n=1 Tax=Pseudobacter ginsenosidimutans TaxID=661488 RepID=A0A4Q7MRY8_9BACT|nr:pyridoxamine 5'-phosphate oxidase [Pseudobacter ginsenosidimutans]QEC41668.1 pyridoxamine 5'-phosphate oxidase [Pseudobacter ginsenosidimutans]RZS71536.1 pyridoxamine 5'-phosphate oxidase [Pseudobacter ginsenosidimutans]
MSTIAAIRTEYRQRSLSEKDVQADPIAQFGKWWEEAVSAQIEEVNAMTLATASVDGLPAARIVLLKEFDTRGFVFFTNYESFKGQQLLENPRACLVFFWKELERQVRITGLVEKVPAAESDAYFNSRPEGSRLGAWVSPQSQVIENREWLDIEEAKKKDEFSGKTIVRPANWGGYLVKPVIIEFWQGRPSRLHDRIQYSLNEKGAWQIERLAP